MTALVTSTANHLRSAWSGMVAELRAANPKGSIEQLVRAGLQTGRYDVLQGVRSAAQKLAVGWHRAYVAAGEQTARWLPPPVDAVRKADPTFDPTYPPSVAWAQANELRLIREIDDETRNLVHGILLDGAKTGAPPAEMAAEIADSIGLTSYQVGIVDNYRRQLEDGEYAAALRRELSSGHSDRAIAAAMRQSRPLAQQQIETAVQRYRANMIAKRGVDIARTEGLRVAHQGNHDLFRQAIAKGQLDADGIERKWNHFHRPGEREFHETMQGQKRGYEEPFISGLGNMLLYPGDPQASAKETVNCTCVVTTRVRRVDRAVPASLTPDVADDGSVDVDLSDLSVEPDDGSVDVDVSDL